MTKKKRAYLHVITLPFVISASWQFLDVWLCYPITLICAMAWFGACVNLAETDKA